MWEALLGIIYKALGLTLRVQEDKNAPDVKKAKMAQLELNKQNEAELAIKNKDEKTISNLLS